jgi:uncharacterized protein YjbI with pentapeptide repeats
LLLGKWRLAVGMAVVVTAGTFALSMGPASADGTVSCPTVNGNTGAVTPAAAPDVDWAGCLLDGADLANADLSDANLSGARFLNADFASADLSDANLAGTSFGPGTTAGVTNLTGANLSGATATSADFDQANLTDANLSKADLSGAFFNFATLTGSDLGSANMTGVSSLTAVISGGITGFPDPMPSGWDLANGYLIGPDAILDGANLAGVDLSGIDLTATAFKNADLADANLTGDTLQNGDLTDANLTGANLSEVSLEGVTVTGANFTQATLYGVSSPDVEGQPATLPANWSMISSYLYPTSEYLFGPGADLAGAELVGFRIDGVDLAGANLSQMYLGAFVSITGSDFTDANLRSVYAEGADLAGDNLTGATAQKADFTDANLGGANFTRADLDGATITGATVTGATWSDTTCPDGTNSGQHAPDGCTTPLDTAPPAAKPAVSAGTAGKDGWFTSSPVTVDWNWTDAGAINSGQCAATSTATGNGSHALTASCADLAGNVGTASLTVKIDATRPAVALTGPANGATYLYGKVPAARCATTDSVSGVAAAAALKVTTTGKDGAGTFTATCSGAVSVAGLGQAAPVKVTYKVAYGFGGFAKLGTPKKSAKTLTVTFGLVSGTGKAIPVSYAAALSAAHAVRVTLRGPGISAVTGTCAWSVRAKSFTCTLAIPHAVKTGKASNYTITAQENSGFGFITAPKVGTAVNPLTIHFQ